MMSPVWMASASSSLTWVAGLARGLGSGGIEIRIQVLELAGRSPSEDVAGADRLGEFGFHLLSRLGRFCMGLRGEDGRKKDRGKGHQFHGGLLREWVGNTTVQI